MSVQEFISKPEAAPVDIRHYRVPMLREWLFAPEKFPPGTALNRVTFNLMEHNTILIMQTRPTGENTLVGQIRKQDAIIRKNVDLPWFDESEIAFNLLKPLLGYEVSAIVGNDCLYLRVTGADTPAADAVIMDTEPVYVV